MSPVSEHSRLSKGSHEYGQIGVFSLQWKMVEVCIYHHHVCANHAEVNHAEVVT